MKVQNLTLCAIILFKKKFRWQLKNDNKFVLDTLRVETLLGIFRPGDVSSEDKFPINKTNTF